MSKKLSKEEQSIMNDIDMNYEDVSGKELLSMQAKAKKRADTFLKKKTISIRMNQNDLEKVKGLALAQNIPYQTLINVAVHKYVKEFA